MGKMFKLITPMPSPNGTNKAQLFVEYSPGGKSPVAAYDAKPAPKRRARLARDAAEGGGIEGLCEALGRLPGMLRDYDSATAQAVCDALERARTTILSEFQSGADEDPVGSEFNKFPGAPMTGSGPSYPTAADARGGYAHRRDPLAPASRAVDFVTHAPRGSGDSGVAGLRALLGRIGVA